MLESVNDILEFPIHASAGEIGVNEDVYFDVSGRPMGFALRQRPRVQRHPYATLAKILANSAGQRQEVYAWLSIRAGSMRRIDAFASCSTGTGLPVGGKTGTGGNRFKAFGPGRRLLSQRVVNRTAAFVFIVGDRFFGTVTAFVPGGTRPVTDSPARWRFSFSRNSHRNRHP